MSEFFQAERDQLFFEDLEVGLVVRGATRKVTRDAVLAFADLVGDRHPIHYDEEYAARSVFGRCVVHGLHLTALAALGANPLSARLHDSMMAFLTQDMRFLAPVFVDDWITAEHRLVELHRSKTKPQGRVCFVVRLLNQSGADVATGHQEFLIRSRSGVRSTT